MAPFSVEDTLRELPVLLALDVLTFFRAALVRFGVDMLRWNRREAFLFHPSELLTYQSLVAVEQASIVRIYSTLNENEGAKNLTLPEGLRRTLDLRHHRHFISHPLMPTDDWGGAMQEFAKQQRGEKDIRAALVLDLVRSIDEAREVHEVEEQAIFLKEVDVNAEMAELYRLILRLSLRGGNHLPTTTESIELLQVVRRRWMEYLAERPDGKRNAP